MTRSLLRRGPVEDKLALARKALAGGDYRTAERALERLHTLTEKPGGPDIFRSRAEATCIAASVALGTDDLPAVLTLVGNACGMLDALGNRPEAFDLVLAILAIPREPDFVADKPSALFCRRMHQIVFLAFPDGPGAELILEDDDQFRGLLSHSDALPLAVPFVPRVLLASALLCIGHAATEKGDFGRAVLAYEGCSRWVEAMSEPMAFAFAAELYHPLALEYQRGGDFAGMRDTYARFEACVGRMTWIDEASRSSTIKGIRAVAQMNLSAQAKNAAGVTVAAAELNQILSDNGWKLPGAQDRMLQDWASGSWPRVDPAVLDLDMPGNAATGYREVMAALDDLRSGDVAAGVRQLLICTLATNFRCTSATRWRAAILMSRMFQRTSAMAALFGKIALRAMEAARLEAVAHSQPFLSVLSDENAERTYRDVADILVGQGRLGEALRVDLLLDQHETGIPVPRVDDIQANSDERCPLTPAETTACVSLRALANTLMAESRSWTARLKPGRVLAHIRAIERQLLEHSVPEATVTPAVAEMVAVSPGVASITIHSSASGGVIASLLDATGFQSVRLPASAQQLNEKVYAVLRALRDRGPDVVDSCKALYDLVLGPFAGSFAVRPPRVLVVQANGPLRRVPFGVLFDGASFLIERFAIVMHPAAEPIAQARGLSRPVNGLCFAISETPGAPGLPRARLDAEVAAATIVASGAGTLARLVDAEATADAVDAIPHRRPGLLLMSCHFEQHPADAAQSAFLLGDGTRYSLARLAQLDLSSVELALLIGCETRAIMDRPGSAGISALDGLMLRLGVGSVVSTAWRVRDDHAHQFLAAFTQHVFRQGHDLADALRMAILSVARDPDIGRMAHPHDWGAYVLTGGWRGLAA